MGLGFTCSYDQSLECTQHLHHCALHSSCSTEAVQWSVYYIGLHWDSFSHKFISSSITCNHFRLSERQYQGEKRIEEQHARLFAERYNCESFLIHIEVLPIFLVCYEPYSCLSTWLLEFQANNMSSVCAASSQVFGFFFIRYCHIHDPCQRASCKCPILSDHVCAIRMST